MFKEKNNIESICVTDFGLADYNNHEGKYFFNRCGSVGFVAPEVLHDQIYDYKIDLYSIGIIMYNVIIEILPFQGDSQKRVYQNYIGKPNPLQRMDVQQALKHPWFNEQNTNQFKLFSIKKRQLVQNKNSLKPSPYQCPGLSPRSPNLQLQPKLTPLQQVEYQKRVTNFCPDYELQPSEQQDKPIPQFIKEQMRKSIFKHLEPLK